MSSREEFESWCVARWGGDRDGFARDPAGKYVLSTLEFAWAAWCARDARIAELERALAECEHQTHSLRVWNGGEYAYHPPQAERIAKIARAAIEKATKQ